MKRAIFSGTKWISCNLLAVVFAVSVSGCSSAVLAETTTVPAIHEAGTEGSAAESEERIAEALPVTQMEAVTAESTVSGTEADQKDQDFAVIQDTLPETAPISSVDISFRYQHMSTHASNQMAVWVESEKGELIKTIFVTNFTASRRGYRNRENALSSWVSIAQPEQMPYTEIDAISGATPAAGELHYSWDLTDEHGNRVPEGIYRVKVEGTLFWESNVLFTAVLDTDNSPSGDLSYETVRSSPENTENETMITDMRMTLVR